MYDDKPIFVIKRDLQKTAQTGYTFKDQLNDDILRDICEKLTGRSDFDCNYVDNAYQDDYIEATYNKGRMATLRYKDKVSFITFSELTITGRNSSTQSVPTAFNIYYLCPYRNKSLYYYFICNEGNALTEYHQFIYRLMETIGFVFLNSPQGVNLHVNKFITIEDMIRARDENRAVNRSNNSTYISKNEEGRFEAFCKTYGASKYESSLICYAMSEMMVGGSKIKLYEIIEGNLNELPAPSRRVLDKMGTVEIIRTDLMFEKNELIYGRGETFRSPKYQYSLLEKLGRKNCALCECSIPEIIQGAHIWPVSSIRSAGYLSIEDKLKHATAGDNGLWLCENHHKLFDRNILSISSDCEVKYRSDVSAEYIPYLDEFTTNKNIPDVYLNDNFLSYVSLRNANIIESAYSTF